MPRVAALMEVIQNGGQAHASYCQPILARRSFDDNVGGISRSFERDVAFGFIHAKIADGALYPLADAKIFDNIELCGIAARQDPSIVYHPLKLDGALLLRKPIRMIQRQAGHSEEQQDGE